SVESRVAAARRAVEVADKRLADAQVKVREAEERRDVAAEGMVRFQRGLEELARRATEHKLAVERFEAVRVRLPEQCHYPEDIPAIHESMQQRIERGQADYVRLERELATAEVRRAEFEAASAALSRIVGKAVAPGDAFHAARIALDELNEAEQLAGRREQLVAEVERLRTQVGRQKVVVGLAERALGKGGTAAAALEE